MARLESDEDILNVLREIRDTLNRIYVCFDDQYLEIQKQKTTKRKSTFKSMLTDQRKKFILCSLMKDI
jgi:hypothetical protein